jgi:hypothetical protein
MLRELSLNENELRGFGGPLAHALSMSIASLCSVHVYGAQLSMEEVVALIIALDKAPRLSGLFVTVDKSDTDDYSKETNSGGDLEPKACSFAQAVLRKPWLSIL